MKSNTISPDKHNYLQISQCIDPKIKSLHYIGSLPNARSPSVAIVGSRRPTAYGHAVANRLAGELAAAGVVVISGLALGIDGIAHRAALEAGGTTIAVLAGGLDKIYPSRHDSLARQIVASGGLLLSEYDAGTPALAHRFLERNRIISGLSDAIVIVEAAARSGTLSTANWGLQQGKTVMAVPGNITQPNSAGCNRLLAAGASVVTGSADVLTVLGLAQTGQQASLLRPDSPAQARLLELLDQGIQDGTELHQKSSLPWAAYQEALTMLELSGFIRPLGADRWLLQMQK